MKAGIFLTAAFPSGLTVIAAAPAGAVVYCDHIGVPTGCVARPGITLRAAPGVGASGVGALSGAGAGAAGLGCVLAHQTIGVVRLIAQWPR